MTQRRAALIPPNIDILLDVVNDEMKGHKIARFDTQYQRGVAVRIPRVHIDSRSQKRFDDSLVVSVR